MLRRKQKQKQYIPSSAQKVIRRIKRRTGKKLDAEKVMAHPDLLSPEQLGGSKFLFGAATSAHQVEGDNVHSDWWQFEKDYTGGVSSGKACNSYELYKEDRKLLQKMGMNSYRFSIEWSRIEPNQGQFDEEAMQHYVDVIDDLIAHGIEPIVTLHHFTNPLWFELLGGWEMNRTVSYFSRYVEYVLLKLAGKVRYYITINEPNIYIYSKYLVGAWHPGEHSFPKAYKVAKRMLATHKAAYKLIKQYRPDAMVGLAVHHTVFESRKNEMFPINALLTGLLNVLMNFHTYNMLWRKHLDFLGLNFYTRTKVSISLQDVVRLRIDPELYKDQTMHFLQYAEDFLLAINALKVYDLPILVTENGVLAARDEIRVDYLQKVFRVMEQARADGAKLIGYQHWSLLDNFEWGYGFEPKFGLHEVDLNTFERTPKPSAKVYADLVAKWRKDYGDGV